MRRGWPIRGLGFRCLPALLAETEGSQIVEFAVSLPLLVVFVVGIFDFGSAFTLKQKIENSALSAARIAASQPTRDLDTTAGCSGPESICALRDAVASNLTAAKVSDCGLASAAASSSGLTWTFTASTGCPGTLTLRIERGHTYTATLAAPFSANYTIEATRVTLSYPYRWQFDNVIKLVAPGATYAGTSQITSVAVMQNVD